MIINKFSVAAVASIAVLMGCDTQRSKSSGSPETPPPSQVASNPGECTGPVLETMDAGSYTYVKLECGGNEVWAAGPQTPLKVGDAVSLNQSMAMSNFESKTLNRTFDSIFFVTSFGSAGEGGVGGSGGLPADHMLASPHQSPTESPATFDFSGIQKPEGGRTVAEIFADKDDLSGKDVLVRGKVVKFTAEVLGKNWIHLQDGTGTTDTNDLTVTTSATAKIGDVILVKGKVLLDKDFGYGYQYDVLVDDAVVTVE